MWAFVPQIFCYDANYCTYSINARALCKGVSLRVCALLDDWDISLWHCR
jgi:hypothetical protein